MERGRDGNWKLRRGPVPCEATVGCAKGHWKRKPDLSGRQRRVLALFWSNRSTYGRSLTDAHLNDRWLMGLLGELQEAFESATRQHTQFMLSSLMTSVALKGGTNSDE